jgi:sentrin-specific protease 8
MLETPVATLADACILPHNLATLAPNQMVDDMVIHFHCALLNSENQNDFFVSPSVTQLLLLSLRDMREQLEPLNLRDYRRVFFPVAHATARRKHWSLLMWRPKSGFLHFDSCGGENRDIARQLATTVLRFYKSPEKPFRSMKAPKQTNSYDCGVYVMAMMRWLARDQPAGDEMVEKINEDYVRRFRKGFEAFLKQFATGARLSDFCGDE